LVALCPSDAARVPEERAFYEAEALRGGWSVRQLDRQIGSQFYTRALLSKNKRAMLEKGSSRNPRRSSDAGRGHQGSLSCWSS
jgi:predicted nuclease of restriction endonuclease-like (RecB) superfamily